MKASAACRDYIRRKERLELTAYRDTAGVLTIGWGHTGPDVHPGDVIDMAQAQTLFDTDVAEAEAEVDRVITVDLTQGMYDCLISFEFNTGGLEFIDRAGRVAPSRLLRALNAGRWNDAVEELVCWNIAGGVDLRGLLTRRLEEGLMFTSERYPDIP